MFGKISMHVFHSNTTFVAPSRTPGVVVQRTSRNRVVWNEELQDRFLFAVKKHSSEATPTLILKEMAVSGLTRENVASHLQKYRLQEKKKEKIQRSPSEKTEDHDNVNNLIVPYQSVINPPPISKKITKTYQFKNQSFSKEQERRSNIYRFPKEPYFKRTIEQIPEDIVVLNATQPIQQTNVHGITRESALSSSVCAAKFNSTVPHLLPVTYSHQYNYPL